MMKEDEEEEEQKRASKEYAPATYTRYPPPSYDYKQPNIRFDETPTKVSLFSYPCTMYALFERMIQQKFHLPWVNRVTKSLF